VRLHAIGYRRRRKLQPLAIKALVNKWSLKSDAIDMACARECIYREIDFNLCDGLEFVVTVAMSPLS
jgi:hypothetical protein